MINGVIVPNRRLVEHLKNARNILVFTGAGISTNSGIPDFRGPQGVWKKRRTVMYQDFMHDETARLEYWDYKLEGWNQYRDAKPNAVHRSIVRLEESGQLCAVITQNIDGLHSRAGTPPEKLVELHGTNTEVECQTCGERFSPDGAFEFFRSNRKAPICDCGGLLKPATISFGQSLCPRDLERAKKAVDAADLVLALGSTLSVYPASSIPLMAADRGASYIIINRGSTEHDGHSSVTLRIEGDVNEVFPPAVASAMS